MGQVTFKSVAARAWKEALAEVRVDTPVRFMTAVVSPFVSAGIVWWATGSAAWAGVVGVAVLCAILLAVFATKLFTVPLTMASEAYGERDDLSERVGQMGQTIAQLAAPPPKPARDPNGVYQLGVQVGHGHGAIRRLGEGIVFFHHLTCNTDFNENSEFEYQDLVLRVASFSTKGNSNLGKTVCDAECTVLGRA